MGVKGARRGPVLLCHFPTWRRGLSEGKRASRAQGPVWVLTWPLPQGPGARPEREAGLAPAPRVLRVYGDTPSKDSNKMKQP